MEFVLILNKIEEWLIAPIIAHYLLPCLTFAQNFQLCGYGQYGMYGSIVNVSTNLDLLQNVLLWISYDDYSISIFVKKIRIQIYVLLSYIRPKLVIKTFKTNLSNSIICKCKSFNWQGFGKLANTKQDDQLQKDELKKHHNISLKKL